MIRVFSNQRGSALFASLILTAAIAIAGAITYVLPQSAYTATPDQPSMVAAAAAAPQATHTQCYPGTWVQVKSDGSSITDVCYGAPSNNSMDECRTNQGCIDHASHGTWALSMGASMATAQEKEGLNILIASMERNHTEEIQCVCSGGARAWRAVTSGMCSKMTLQDFAQKKRCIMTMNLPDGKKINCAVDNGQVHGLTSADDASCKNAGPPKQGGGTGDATTPSPTTDPCAAFSGAAHDQCVKQQQTCTGGTAVGCQSESPAPDTSKQPTRVPDGTTCDPACTGTQVCISGTCVNSGIQPTNTPTQTQTGCPSGTYGIYPNCQITQTQGYQGQMGGLSQMPQQQAPQQQVQQQQPYTYNCPSYAQNTYSQQSYQCAQNINQYNQLWYTARNDYASQVNQYNSCMSQQTSQCPAQCQQPYQPQIQMCQNTQSAPYGVGSDGNSCAMPPAQPDASECSNGYWKAQSQTGNGCTTGWQCVSNNACQSSPAQPDATTCTSGVWQPIYQPGNTNSSCVSGWQCVTNVPAKVAASLSCAGPSNSTYISPGQTLTLGWSCQGSDSSTGYGFDTSGQTHGTTTITQVLPPNGQTLATYTLSCHNSSTGNSAGAQCSVNIISPKIVLSAVPGAVAAGGSSSIGWITTNMNACTISSPDLPDFTSENADNTSINGGLQTPALTSATHFLLTCTSLSGGTSTASTTVTVQ